MTSLPTWLTIPGENNDSFFQFISESVLDKNIPQTFSQVKNYPNVEARKLSTIVREIHPIIPHEKRWKGFLAVWEQTLYHWRCMQYLTINQYKSPSQPCIGISNDETSPEEAHVQKLEWARKRTGILSLMRLTAYLITKGGTLPQH